jgi:hypothetical protein
LFSLAERLKKTVSELERELTPRELAEWQAYFRIQKKEAEKK